MRALFKLFFWLLFLSPFVLIALGWLALSDQALITHQVTLSHADIARAQTIIKQNDPRRLPAGTNQQVTIAESDLNLAANYLIQKVAEGGAEVRLHKDLADAVGTLRIPTLPMRAYLNITLRADSTGGQPDIKRLQIGELRIPAPLARWLLKEGLQALYQTREFELASNLVQGLNVQPGKLLLTYRWDPALIAKARKTLLDNQDTAALQAYHAALVQLQAEGIGTRGSLSTLLARLFQTAHKRSINADPIAENRALLAVLGAWASGHGLTQLVPNAAQRPQQFNLRLDERKDFGQHFLTSAALAAQGDTQFADAVGLFKEISDSQGGSGFSFTDIAADRAGVQFGELATRSVQSARQLQTRMLDQPPETHFMPRARDLPEHMNAQQFKARYGSVGSPRYRAVMDEIEQRIARCQLYRKA